ncbi:YodC family protein [Sphingomonas phyllosphaerae]|uniref:YodC family protein n=1 Tax=Sphingomonas phyllosphaerae TaxID=257003 RepID=UPI003FA6C6A2
MEEFAVGDTVKLKSGGPTMTVTVVGDRYGTPTVWTTWFDGTKKFDGDFPPAALIAAETRSPIRRV